VLAEEFMKPLGLSARALGAAIGVPGNRVSDIVRGKRDVSADTAIRLSRYFGGTRVSGSIFKRGTISRRLLGSTIILDSRHGLPRNKEGGHRLSPFHNNPRRYEPIVASLAGGSAAR
jgi:transcriptional regulator with XRE-family HTH domain